MSEPMDASRWSLGRRATALVAPLMIAAMLAPTAAPAQGTLKGCIKDNHGGVLPGVEVVASNLDGSAKAVTDITGCYRVRNVKAGTYAVTATLGLVCERRTSVVNSHVDKTVLVTGANNGIGAAIVRAFARQGARIGLHFLETAPSAIDGVQMGHTFTGRAGAEAVAGEIRALGMPVAVVPADLADPAAIGPLFDSVEAVLGPVDILVNNAAHFENPDTVFDVSAGTFDRYFAVNSRAPALLMREFGLRFRARNARFGRIINISTDAARVFATQIGYGASKSALEALTRSVAYELGPLGITVNAIAPGPVQTGYITPEMEQQLLPTIPLRRLGTPSDIADVVLLFASEQARWMTGQVVQVAGGHAL